MCYYNSVKLSNADLFQLLQNEQQLEAYEQQLQSGFDYGNWPVVLTKFGNTVMELAHWELIPFWYRNANEVKAGRKKYTTLNAKGEGLLTSRIYGEAARKRRCLVLSSGFYEWRHFAGNTYPYFIKVKDRNLFYMAGVWQTWTDKETGEMIDSFALVTTEANELMAEVHNTKKRMPTILTDEWAQAWLDPNLPEEEVRRLAVAHTTDKLTAHTIRKDFRTAPDPQEFFAYPELPPLTQA